MRRIYLILHPHVPFGWRWAVHLDLDDPVRLERCVNAGWAPNQHAADEVGQLVAYSVLSALRLAGADAQIQSPLMLAADPLIGVDTLNHLHN